MTDTLLSIISAPPPGVRTQFTYWHTFASVNPITGSKMVNDVITDLTVPYPIIQLTLLLILIYHKA